MFKEITKDNYLLLTQHNYDKPILNSESKNFMMILKDLNILKDFFVNTR